MIPRLHLITNDEILARSNFLKTSEELLVVLQRHVALHVRGHATAARDLFAITARLAERAAHVQSLLVVNDRVDIALGARARAVQLGVRSLPIERVRAIAPDLTIGFSAHSAQQATAAERANAGFIIAGSIYPTTSHAEATPSGLALLDECVAACSVPVLAIGGVTVERVREVNRTGAYGVAVIRAVWDAPDPVHAAEEFVKMLEA